MHQIPVTGRYISRDPLGYKDGLNCYLYVHNNPINRIDPLGLWDLWQSIKNVGAAIVSPITMTADVVTAGLIKVNNMVSDTKVYSEDAHFSSGLGQRLANNVSEDAGAGSHVRAAAVVALAMPTGGGSVVADNIQTVFDQHMSPEQAREFLTQAAGDQVVGAWAGALGSARTRTSEPTPTRGGKAPDQVTPGTVNVKGVYDPESRSAPEPYSAHYDQFGRQIGRTDYTDQPNPANHTNPHHHTTTYRSPENPGFGPKGFEEGPFDGPHPLDGNAPPPGPVRPTSSGSGKYPWFIPPPTPQREEKK